MKTDEELKIKSKIVNEVMDNIVADAVQLERSFMDDFGMTIDQFEKLEISDQKKIIEKVSKFNKKKKKLFNYYLKSNNYSKKNKIKSIFKKI